MTGKTCKLPSQSQQKNADLTPTAWDSESLNETQKLENMASTNSERNGCKWTLFGGKLLLLALILPSASGQTQTAQNCISLASTRTCPSWSTAFISLGLTDKFPFLRFVNTTDQFDNEFERYIRTDYTQAKYENLFGCPLGNLANTTDLYARYTATILCSSIVQESIAPCGLTPDQSEPLCVEYCGEWARSEYEIVADNQTCGDTKVDYIDLIRADLTICQNPPSALTGHQCVNAVSNEGYNCGYGDNLPGLCLYCNGSSIASTDTCCYNANATVLCQNVRLPNITSIPPDLYPTSTAAPAAAPAVNHERISGGAIAGIVIGSIIAATLILFLFLFWKRRKDKKTEGYLNRPSPLRNTPRGNMTYPPSGPVAEGPRVLDPLPGSRIARMSALEAANGSGSAAPSPPALQLTERTPRVIRNNSAEYGLEDSPHTAKSGRSGGSPKYPLDNRPLHPTPRDRQASLSSTSVLHSDNHHSDSEKENSPQLTTAPSEQLPFFKDYYSKDDIHPGDKVAVLWAYSPRAADEFELERGDMLRVIGIWDDGWATGIRLNERAEDYVRTRPQRDSGVSASQISRTSRDRRTSSPTPDNREVKAFPLVCVCLPEHWQKTIDSDGQASDWGARSRQSTEQSTREGQLSDPETSSPRRIQERPSSRFREDLNPPPDPPT